MANYIQAAIRHWTDSSDLGDRCRFDNASHLLGFALECALKEKMQLAGANAAKVHIPELFNVYRARMKGRQVGFSMDINLLANGPDSFFDWDVGDRYEADGHVDEVLWKGRKKRAGQFMASLRMMRKK